MRMVLILGLIIPGISIADKIDPWEIQFENARYKYLLRDFFEASADFNKLVQSAEEGRVGRALHYSILSLAAMNQRTEVLQKLKIYRKITQPETLFGATEFFFKWGDYEASEEILKISQRMLLAPEQLDRQRFLSAKTLIQLKEGRNKPLENLDAVREESKLYLEAQSLKARLFFRDREFKAATSTLEDLLLKVKKKSIPKSNIEGIKLLLGKMYFENREFNKAETYFNEIKEAGLFYPALTGRFWVYFETDRFTDAVKTLLKLRRIDNKRFIRDRNLINLAFSAFYAEDYEQAKTLFDELKIERERRKRAMEEILSDGKEAVAISVVKEFMKNAGNAPIVPGAEIPHFSDNRELLDAYKNRVILGDLGESGAGVIKKSSELQMTYQMEFGALDSFVENFDDRVERLDSRYESLKKEVGTLNFEVGGTVHNKNYFKEWFESNLSQFSKGKMQQLTDFEKKVVQMFTHEIMYRQKVDTDFITKIVANKKSLENLHSLASTEWPQRIKKIISDHDLGLKELDQVDVIFNRLKEMNGEIRSLGQELLKKSVVLVKKEAFRLLIEQESTNEDIKTAYSKIQEALSQFARNGNTEKSR